MNQEIKCRHYSSKSAFKEAKSCQVGIDIQHTLTIDILFQFCHVFANHELTNNMKTCPGYITYDNGLISNLSTHWYKVWLLKYNF